MMQTNNPTLFCNGISVGIHGGHDVNPRVVDQKGNEPGVVVVGTDDPQEVEQEDATYDLVAVHVCYVLEFRFT